MRDDPIALLERELLDAARRRAVVADEHEGSSHEPRGPWPAALRPARRRSSLGAFASLVASGLALAVAVGALVALHGRGGSPPARSSAAAKPSSRQQLIDILGVVRRPQARADLHSPAIAQVLRPGGGLPGGLGTADVSLVRRAAVTPWGAAVFVVPVKPSARSGGAEAVMLASGSGAGCCATAADLRRYGDLLLEGAGHSFAGGAAETRFTLLVPDGVSRVRFSFPSLGVSVPVRGNIAAVQVNRPCCSGQPGLVWYGANGQVIKRIVGTNPPPRPGRPGPETAQSRAAERDPSTPNRVWVTPRVGGPHTKFMVHFRVLLNGADYSYRLSGTRCPAITPAGGGGGGTDDLRGRTWSGPIDAVQGQTWCPGTYRLSVAVMGRKHAGPFGTATFTVKR